MSERNLYNIILSPCVTEKATTLAGYKHKQLSFKVAKKANKSEIKRAIERIFKVTVLKVRTLNMVGKTRVYKQRAGKLSDWKKAIVTLNEGHDINLSEFVGGKEV